MLCPLIREKVSDTVSREVDDLKISVEKHYSMESQLEWATNVFETMIQDESKNSAIPGFLLRRAKGIFIVSYLILL